MPTVEFFFDVASPYSYLASTQVDAVAARAGGRVRWRPFLLGGVFKATGNLPPATVSARQPWLLQDLSRWAAHYGVPFAFPDFFPINSLLPMRSLAALDEREVPAAAAILFRAHWAEGINPGEPEALASLLGPEALVRAADPVAKDRLRANTAEAVARGAFGAPTFFVGEQMSFGNDRLHFVEQDLRRG